MVETTYNVKSQPFTGGCQCGAMRYELTAAPDHVSVCHCRMCQKASGGPIMAFARVKDHQLRWTRGRPAAFRSSSLAERHFCAACGTPLSYHFIGSGDISVTVCSLDDPEAVRPSAQYCVDRALSWFAGISGLPGQRLDEVITEELAARFVDHQHPDHDT